MQLEDILKGINTTAIKLSHSLDGDNAPKQKQALSELLIKVKSLPEALGRGAEPSALASAHVTMELVKGAHKKAAEHVASTSQLAQGVKELYELTNIVSRQIKDLLPPPKGEALLPKPPTLTSMTPEGAIRPSASRQQGQQNNRPQGHGIGRGGAGRLG